MKHMHFFTTDFTLKSDRKMNVNLELSYKWKQRGAAPRGPHTEHGLVWSTAHQRTYVLLSVIGGWLCSCLLRSCLASFEVWSSINSPQGSLGPVAKRSRRHCLRHVTTLKRETNCVHSGAHLVGHSYTFLSSMTFMMTFS